MNKKLLFGIMSLAALAACTNDDFESQQQVAEQTSPIQFEVVNTNAAMRASMNGDKIAWSAADGDLFTLYHGNITAIGYQNATYKAEMDGAAAKLTTPSMILPGKAIMVWPVDTTFTNNGSAAGVNISIPAEQKNIENNIPYVSDVINITADAFPANQTAGYNKSGYARKYPIYMRPMASQLTIKADYAGTDDAINALATGADPINAIAVTSIDLSNSAAKYTTEIALAFTAATGTETTRWNAAEPNNAWSDVVSCAGTATTQVQKLTAKDKCLLSGNTGCKFLILPQSVGDANSSVVVNTTYGKVVIAGTGTAYTGAELADAWYRFISATTVPATGETKSTTAETTGDNNGKYKTTASVQDGMTQTFTAINTSAALPTDKYVAGEYTGGTVTRYVKVLLSHLDMNGLHITSDKQLYDAVRVWKQLNLPTVTVNLDGDATTGEFEISQKTIKKINEINAAAPGGKSFSVQPCNVAGEACSKIVITGGDAIQNLAFIKFNDVNGNSTFEVGTDVKADVVLKAGESWNWSATAVGSKKAVIVDATATGVQSIINKGTLTNGATATLAVYNNASPAVQVATIPFRNEGTWNVTSGDLNVQFDVTNVGTVNISSGAEYHQDGAGNNFTNDAVTLPQRFLAAGTETVGEVVNKGVLACVNSGKINNYGVIRHDDPNAKTYITSNMSLTTDGFTANAAFGTAFNPATSGAGNKMGWIILPYSNKDEENVSISNAAANGFVSVEISTTAGAPANGKLDLSAVGAYVNYCIIKGGVTEISAVAAAIKYVEFDAGTTEIAWKVATATYDGLVVFSPVNVQRGTAITVNNSAFLKAKMYVGGSTTLTKTKCDGYFGDTQSNFDTMYLTY